MATRNYLFFPNTDHVLAPGWDESLIPRLAPRKVVSLQCIEPGIVPVAPTFHAVNCGTRWDEFDELRFNESAAGLAQDVETPGINYPFVLSKQLWEEVGGLDERFDPGPANDPDLFYRLWFAGAELARAEDVIIYHFSGKSSRMADEARQERAEWHAITDRNEGRFVEKWGERYQYANGGLPKPGPEALRRWEEMRAPVPTVRVASRLKVVLDGRSVGPKPDGISLYTQNLVRALARRKDGPLLHCMTSALAEGRKAFGTESSVVLSPCNAMSADPRQDREVVCQQIRKAKGDLIHGPAFYVPSAVGIPSVVTVHDLAFTLHPEWYPKEFVQHLTRIVRESLDTSDGVIATSECTRRDLLKFSPQSGAKTHLIFEALPEETLKNIDVDVVENVKNTYAGGEDFILSVGVQQRRKNAIGLVEAFALLRRKSKVNPKLVLVGGADCEDPGLSQTIQSLGLASEVVLTGHVPTDVLAALYRSAALFVYPSLYEGFGFPPLEAMAHGVPVVCSDRGSLPEVVGQAAKLVDPENRAALAQALEEVLVDPDCRKTLKDLGAKQVARFSWDRAAEETLSVYSQCAESSSVSTGTLVQGTSPDRAGPTRPARLRVAIDARMLAARGTGTGRYTLEILRALWSKDREAEYVLIGPEVLVEDGLVGCGYVIQHVVAGPETLLNPAWEQFSLPSHLLGCDVLFSPTGIVPVARPCRAVSVIHDLGFEDYPDFYAPALRGHLSRWVRNACQSADRLIAVSRFTRDRMNRHYGVFPGSIEVVHHGCSRLKSPRADSVPTRTSNPGDKLSVLCLASFEPNKNHASLIKAFASLPVEMPVELVLAGRRGRELEALQSLARTKAIPDRIRFVIDPDDGHLQKLLERTTVFVYPSLYEGFGLPIVEAMAEGLPIITSRKGSCGEVAGDGAVVVDEPSPELLSQALTALLNDEPRRKELSRRALARADSFDWGRAADATWSVIETCAGSR